MEGWPNEGELLLALGVGSLVKYLTLYVLHRRRPRSAEYVGRVSRLVVFPVKSMRGLDLQTVTCTYDGMQCDTVSDRQWMVTTKDYTFVSARQEPRLALITATPDDQWLHLEVAGVQSLHVARHLLPTKATSVTAKVWGEPIPVLDCGEEASKWLASFLGRDAGHRLVYHPPQMQLRAVLKPGLKWYQSAKIEDKVAFQDGFPFMLMADSSVADLNSRLTTPVVIDNFRPNIVVTDCEAYDEDNWGEVFIGNTKFTNCKPCERCVMTTVNPKTGQKDPDIEPLKTLRSYRKLVKEFGDSPCFGVNLVVDWPGTISVGEDIYATRK